MSKFKVYYFPSKDEWIVKEHDGKNYRSRWHFSNKAYGDLAEKMANQSALLGRRVYNYIEERNDHCVMFCKHKDKVYEIYFDKEDFEKVMSKRWFVQRSHQQLYCVESHTNLKMHRFLLELADKTVLVDHIDRDGLNNRKENLRESDYLLNAHNRSTSANNLSGKNGVHYNSIKGYYIARISYENRRIEKSFSVKKYGKDKALLLAIEARRKLEKEYGFEGE